MTDSTITSEPGIDASGFGLMTGAQAEQALRSAIQRLEQIGDGSLDLAQALIKLGTLRQEKGSHSEAEELFRRALDISERTLGSEHIELVQALTSLGAARVILGSPETAEPLFGRALSISTRYLGEDHPDLVLMVNDIARLYLKHGAYSFAEPQLQRLLSMKRSKGDDHPEVATVLASLAAVNQARGRHEIAEDLWRRVLAIRERTLAPNHFAQAIAVEHLAEVCAARGKTAEALQLFQRAQTIREMTLGSGHASLRILRERIADLQLQASEDATEVLFPQYPRSGGMQSGSARPVERELARPLQTNAEDIRPTPRVATTDDAKQREAAALAYRAALLHERQNAYEEDEEETGGHARGLFAPIAPFLRKHQGEALAVGAVLIVLVIVVATTTRASGEIDQPIIEPTSVATVSPPAINPRPLTQAIAPVIEPVSKNPAPIQTTAAPPHPVERRKTDNLSERKEQSPRIAIPSVPVTMTSRFDSLVKAAGATSGIPNVVIAPSPPEWSGSNTKSSIFSGAEPATEGRSHSRLIGALPTPHYPSQLRGGIEGDVIVRFNVDTAGHPMMSTFSVVKSPHELLTAAVRRVIENLRFEPARSGGVESKPTVDLVEIRYVFSPSTR